MSQKGIKFRVMDVETPEGLAELAFLGMDIKTVPVVQFGEDDVVIDFDEMQRRIQDW